MNSTYYKHCIVPRCKSTTIKTPNKLFIYVPSGLKTRQKWLKVARRNDVNSLSLESRMYFCEDHFDLPNDMLNYMEYHIMGTVSQVRMKPGCIPSKFECQEDRNKRTSHSIDRSHILKKQRMMTIADRPNDVQESGTPGSSHLKDTSDTISDYQTIGEDVQEILSVKMIKEEIEEKEEDKISEAFTTYKFRSKTVETNLKAIEQALSPLRSSQISCCTSLFKGETIIKSKPSMSSLSNIPTDILIKQEHSDDDISVPSSSGSPSMYSLQTESDGFSQMSGDSDCSEFIKEERETEASETIAHTLNKIDTKPQLYIGVPHTCYHLIDLIKNEINIPKHYILFCLQKIRLDNSFNQLADEYGESPSYLSKIFLENIPYIASAMRPFIVTLDSKMIKKTLPVAFRHKFYNVSCIIDCLEIEIQKPSKAVNQALTWSDYKKANTIKYLISYTPNGLVNYISPGIGGKITDTYLVKSCDFIKTLQSGMYVMADQGFKHIEQYLLKSGIKLVRLPSVETGKNISKREAKLTKQTSLRIHVKSVIGRLHEFYMLKSHSCINRKFVKILDDIIVIACALVNLQDSLVQ